MHDGTGVSRRGFLTAAAGGVAGAAATGAAGAQENGTNGTAGGNATGDNASGGGNESGGGGGGGPPDFGGYLSDAANYDGTVADATGQDRAQVAVGADANNALSFGPAAIHVDNGATVVWEWTGEGGAHNVIAEDGTFDSGTPVGEAGATFEHTFAEDGIYNYYCDPHKGAGMKGSVVVGTDYPTVDTGGDGGGPQFVPDAAKTLGIATSVVMAATLGLAYVFIRYGGGWSPE